jgi:hypothetical protein
MAVYPPPNNVIPNFNPAQFPDEFISSAAAGSSTFQELDAQLDQLTTTLNAMIAKLAFIGSSLVSVRNPTTTTIYSNGGTTSTIYTQALLNNSNGFAHWISGSFYTNVGVGTADPSTFFNLVLTGPTHQINNEIIPWTVRAFSTFAFADIGQNVSRTYRLQVAPGNTAGATNTLAAIASGSTSNIFSINIK